jgi:acyl carrier protein
MKFEDFTEKLIIVFDETTVGQLNENPNLDSLSDWNSLAALSLMAFYEEEFGIVLEAEHIREVKSIMDLFDLINVK